MKTVKLTSNYTEHKQDGTVAEHKVGDTVSLEDHDASVAVNTGFGSYVDHPPETEAVPESKIKAASDVGHSTKPQSKK